MAFVNCFEHSFPIARFGTWIFDAYAWVRTPSVLDGRSDSYAGIGYPMMTVRRRAASLWPRTSAFPLSKMNSRIPSTALGVLADADRRIRLRLRA